MIGYGTETLKSNMYTIRYVALPQFEAKIVTSCTKEKSRPVHSKKK